MNTDDLTLLMKQVEAKKHVLYKIAYSYTKNPHDAEDCVADAVLTAMQKLRQLRDEESFYPWFVSILVNTCRKFYRKNKKHIELNENICEPDILNQFSGAEDRILIEEVLSSLRKEEADILVLKYLDDFSLKEISEIMTIPENTIKSKIHRSLKNLRKLYGGLQNG